MPIASASASMRSLSVFQFVGPASEARTVCSSAVSLASSLGGPARAIRGLSTIGRAILVFIALIVILRAVLR